MRYILLRNGKVYDLEGKGVSSWEYDKEEKCYNIYYYDLYRGRYLEHDDKGGQSMDAFYDDAIRKFGDIISDLTDGYWWENEHYSDPIFNPNVYAATERLQAWIDSDKQLNSNTVKDIAVYGSVYIKGDGWHHISKLVVEGDKIKEVLL